MGAGASAAPSPRTHTSSLIAASPEEIAQVFDQLPEDQRAILRSVVGEATAVTASPSGARGLVDVSALTVVAKDENGLPPQPVNATYRGAIVQIFVRKQAYGGSDKSSNGHRFDSIPFASGMISAGMSCQLIHYTHEEHDKFLEVCRNFDFVIVRVNPGHIRADGGDEAKFDDGLRTLRGAGVQVWPTPEVTEAVNAQDMLCKVSHLSIGLPDTLAYYSPEDFSIGFKTSLKFQPRVLKQARGSSGEGTWIVKLKSGAYCKEYGSESCCDDDILQLTEICDNHTEEHTVAEFIEFCINGRTQTSGVWRSKGAGKYLEGGKAAGSQIVDQRFCPRVLEGELRYNLAAEQVISIVHQSRKEGGISYTHYEPGEAKFKSLTDTFLQELPKLMPALGLEGEAMPLSWTADFVLTSPQETPAEEEKWTIGAIDCSCVSMSKCQAAICKDTSPRASISDISQEDLQHVRAHGELMGAKAIVLLNQDTSPRASISDISQEDLQHVRAHGELMGAKAIVLLNQVKAA